MPAMDRRTIRFMRLNPRSVDDGGRASAELSADLSGPSRPGSVDPDAGLAERTWIPLCVYSDYVVRHAVGHCNHPLHLTGRPAIPQGAFAAPERIGWDIDREERKIRLCLAPFVSRHGPMTVEDDQGRGSGGRMSLPSQQPGGWNRMRPKLGSRVRFGRLRFAARSFAKRYVSGSPIAADARDS